MSRRVSKAGGANAYGVYGFIRDLIMEGKDAEFVDNRGRYRLNWPRALDRYADYKAKKKPHLKRTNQINRRTDSNRLRSALLNSYKKEGAREHKESKKVNEEDQVVERQFQMPPRVFEALFSDAKLSDSNEEQDEQEGKTHLSEGADGAQASHESSSDAGFNETMDSSFDFLGSPDSRALLSTSRGNVLTNPSLDDSADVKTEGPGNHFSDSAFQITQIFDDDSVESAVEEFLSESDEIFGHDCFMGVVRDIFPASGPVKGGYYFEISLSEPLPDNVSSGVAEFEGVGTAALTKLKPSKLFGFVPASDKARDVRVKVSSQSGECLGCTDFHYVDEMREMIKQLIHDPVKLSSFMTMWLQECHFYGFEMQFQGDVDFTTQAKQKQLVKILELLVYTAAQTGAKQFIEMIFSTSAQQIVFDSYKERATLPENVARANGHFNLAQYLQDINTRLTKEVGDEPKSIDWLELLKAVQNQVSVSQDKESKKEKTPVENDDYSSDYFADDETSSCGSFEHDDEYTSNPEGKDTAEKGGSITNLLQRYGPYDERIVISNSKVLEAGAYRHQNLVLHRDITAANIVLVSTEETSSEATKCRGVYESKEERRALMTENVVVSASTCRLKRPGYLVLSPLEADERQLNQEQVIFAKSIGDESVHSPSTLLPSCPVLHKSSQSSCGASLHGLSSGNVSWKKESKIKELKMARVRSWLSCKPSSEEFLSAEGETSSERTKCRSVSRIEEEKRLLTTENAVISASTCRLKRPACSRLPKVYERHLNLELGNLEKSIGDESVHSPSTLLPSCSILNKSPPQTSCSASLYGLFPGDVSWKNESNVKVLKTGCFMICGAYVSPVEKTSSEATKCRGVYESKEERRALMTENVVVSASTCRLKRPGYLVLSPLEADERQLNQEQVIFAKSIGDESVHSPSTLLPSCPVLNKSSQSSCGASLHGLSSGNVSWKKESKIKELKMARVRSWLSCKPSSEEFPSAEGFET